MKRFILSLLALMVLSHSSAAFADSKDEFIRRRLQERAERMQFGFQLPVNLSVQGGTIDQKLDHDNAGDTRTFKQRYWMDSTYALNSDSPVLYYICGESVCDESSLSRGTIIQYAQALHANLVTLEHRYYGKSQPFDSLTTENLKYLNMANALADLAAFQSYATTNFGMKGKWIAIGGSYAGALSAFYRLKYPNNVVGALASSAPVFMKANFEEYDRHVSKVSGPDCAAKIRGVVKQIEGSLVDSTRLKQIQDTFGANDVKDPVDFLYVVADEAAFAIQYGFSQRFCDALDSADPLTSYAQVGAELFNMAGMTPLMDSFQSAENLDPNANQNFELRQWMYQSCTEFGYYQTAFHDPAVSVRSSRIDLAYHNAVCKRLFNIDTQVDTDATNHQYYELLLHPETSAIFFTNGSTDPWSNLSITVANGNATNPALDLMTLDGGSHCSDLSSGDSTAQTAARAEFLSLAQKWLN